MTGFTIHLRTNETTYFPKIAGNGYSLNLETAHSKPHIIETNRNIEISQRHRI